MKFKINEQKPKINILQIYYKVLQIKKIKQKYFMECIKV